MSASSRGVSLSYIIDRLMLPGLALARFLLCQRRVRVNNVPVDHDLRLQLGQLVSLDMCPGEVPEEHQLHELEIQLKHLKLKERV